MKRGERIRENRVQEERISKTTLMVFSLLETRGFDVQQTWVYIIMPRDFMFDCKF